MCRCLWREGVGCRQMVDMIAGPGHVPAAGCGEDLGRAGVAGITIQPLSLIICTLFCNLHWGSGIRWISPPDNLSLQPRLAQMNTKQQLSSPLLSSVQTCRQCLTMDNCPNWPLPLWVLFLSAKQTYKSCCKCCTSVSQFTFVQNLTN